MKSILLSVALAITHVTVIDTQTGALRPDTTVVVREGRIAAIGDKVPADVQIIEGRGKFLIPGLWDMHVHLSWAKDSALYAMIANGVTAVRDLGSTLGEVDAWRTKIDAGLMPGPRIYRAGPILNGQKFNQFQLVPGNADATRGVVRALKYAGVDFIKVHRRMERDSYFAALDEAKKLGLPLVGHVPMTVSPEEASDAGQKTIEHVATLFEGTFESSLNGRDEIAAMREWRTDGGVKLAETFVKNHTVFDPTLVAYDPDFDERGPNAKYVATSFRPAPDKAAPTAEQIAGQHRMFEEFKETVRLMNRGGVTIVTGSDTAASRVPGFFLQKELVFLVESGLTPLEALRAATINSASVLNAEGGVIEAGKLADLVLLDANPIDDIHNTQRIAAVIAAGRLYRRTDLAKLLREAERLAESE